MNCADGTLTYGDWSQCVRVDDFHAEINQAETGIEWSLSASYSLFPNEGGYATAEYTVNDREDVESGDEFFAFNGKISAPTQALAMAKLNSLRTAVLAMYGWTLAQRLRDEASTQSVYANGDATTYPAGSGVADAADGTTFIELSFSEDYRRRIQGLLVGCTLAGEQPRRHSGADVGDDVCWDGDGDGADAGRGLRHGAGSRAGLGRESRGGD